MQGAIDWSQEVVNSAIWLGKAFGITVVVFFIVMALLARFTVWGRQFWALNGAYFALKRSWKPLAGVALMLIITLAAVRLNVLFSHWYRGFYNALQALDAPGFWFHMGLFAMLATIHVARALFNS
jgi:vitamin B12/bleomycin/antimicrobial peptide transport system ATP-binding/permease protein